MGAHSKTTTPAYPLVYLRKAKRRLAAHWRHLGALATLLRIW